MKEDISKLYYQNNKEKQQQKKKTIIIDFNNVQNKIYESLQNYCSNIIKISEEFSIILKWKQNTEPKIEYTPYTIVIMFSKKDEKFQAEISLYVNNKEIHFQEVSKIIQGKDFKFIVCKVMKCIEKLLDILKCKYNLNNLQIKTIQTHEIGKKNVTSCVQPKFSTYNAEISINDEWIKRELAKGYNPKAIINQIGRRWR